MRPHSQRLPSGWHREASVLRPLGLGLLPAAGRRVPPAECSDDSDAGARSAGVLLWPAARVGAVPCRQRRRRRPDGAPGAQRRGGRRVRTCAACQVSAVKAKTSLGTISLCLLLQSPVSAVTALHMPCKFPVPMHAHRCTHEQLSGRLERRPAASVPALRQAVCRLYQGPPRFRAHAGARLPGDE